MAKARRVIMTMFIRPGGRAYLAQQNLFMHPMEKCKGNYCPFHSPSGHKLNRAEPVSRPDIYWRTDRICVHGTLHPDPDSVAHLLSIKGATAHHHRAITMHKDPRNTNPAHCCGCCGPIDNYKGRLKREAERTAIDEAARQRVADQMAVSTKKYMPMTTGGNSTFTYTYTYTNWA